MFSGKDDNKYVHRPDLLCSFLYFDKNRVGYLEDDDLYTIIHSIGLNISRSQITVCYFKVLLFFLSLSLSLSLSLVLS